MAQIPPNIQIAITNISKIHPQFSVREFKEEFSEVYDRQPSEAEKQFFLQCLSNNAGDILDVLETLGVQVVLRYSESYPDLLPQKVDTTANQISNIANMRERRTAVCKVLNQLNALEPLLSASDLAVVRKYVKDILLPGSGGDDQIASAILAVTNIAFPLDSLNSLINRNNQIIDSDLYKEILENRNPITLPIAFVAVVDAPNVTNMGPILAWNSTSFRTFYVNPEITEGIYKITIECKGNLSGISLMLGLIAKDQIVNLSQIPNQQNLSSLQTGTCAFCCGGIYTANAMVLSAVLFSAAGTATAVPAGSPNTRVVRVGRAGYPAGPAPPTPPATPAPPTQVSLELNAYRRVLYCLVNGEQVPHTVINVPSPVHFALSGQTQGITAELKSLTRLAAPTINVSLNCAQYKWK